MAFFQISLYLFLGGLSAGLFFVSAVAKFLQNGDGRHERIARRGTLLAPWPVALGSTLLIFDLGNAGVPLHPPGASHANPQAAPVGGLTFAFNFSPACGALKALFGGLLLLGLKDLASSARCCLNRNGLILCQRARSLMHIPMKDRRGREFLYLSQADVRQVGLSMAEIIEALERMFREKGAGRVEMPPKPGIHTAQDAFLHAMPAYIPAEQAAGMKWVGGYPHNQRFGLPYITGLLILNDVETGVPLSVMDCIWITAERTGAATAIAAKYLARPESHTAGILGCGVQGRSNLVALGVAFSLSTVRAYDVDQNAREIFAREMSAQLRLDVIPVSDPKAAVVGSDIVVTAGPILRTPHATIQRGWLNEGAFASLVDFDSYWHPDALREIDKFCTDDVAQLEHYRGAGYFEHIPPIYSDLGALAAGGKRGRETPHERTMSCNLGLGLEDIAVAPLIYRRAVEKGMGTWLPL